MAVNERGVYIRVCEIRPSRPAAGLGAVNVNRTVFMQQAQVSPALPWGCGSQSPAPGPAGRGGARRVNPPEPQPLPRDGAGWALLVCAFFPSPATCSLGFSLLLSPKRERAGRGPGLCSSEPGSVFRTGKGSEGYGRSRFGFPPASPDASSPAAPEGLRGPLEPSPCDPSRLFRCCKLGPFRSLPSCRIITSQHHRPPRLSA